VGGDLPAAGSEAQGQFVPLRQLPVHFGRCLKVWILRDCSEVIRTLACVITGNGRNEHMRQVIRFLTYLTELCLIPTAYEKEG
jgi:hypothetical protein